MPDNTRSLHLFGCVPALLNMQMELAQEVLGVEKFIVLENIERDTSLLKKIFRPLPNWEVDFLEYQKWQPQNTSAPLYALSLVGPKSKKKIFNQFQTHFNLLPSGFVNLIHPTCYVAPSVTLSQGIQIEPMSIVASMSNIGFGVNIKRGTNIGHHCVLSDYVTINPGVTLSGEVHVGEQTTIGTGAIIRDAITIGSNSLIGAGSVVVKDIPDNVVAFGNPCKVVKAMPL